MGTGNTMSIGSWVCPGTGTGMGLPYPWKTVPVATGLRVFWCRISSWVSGHMALLIHSQTLNNRGLMITNTPNCRHEQLLVGWKQGATTTNNDIDGHHHPPLSLSREGGFSFVLGNHHHHHPLPCSKCERGGSRSFWVTTTTTTPSLTGGGLITFSVTAGTTPPSLSRERGGFLVCSG